MISENQSNANRGGALGKRRDCVTPLITIGVMFRKLAGACMGGEEDRPL